MYICHYLLSSNGIVCLNLTFINARLQNEMIKLKIQGSKIKLSQELILLKKKDNILSRNIHRKYEKYILYN